MDNIILVNATASKSGGALTILKEYLSELRKSDKETIYYVFCGTDLLEYNTDNIRIVKVKTQGFGMGGLKRLFWDYAGLFLFCKMNKIRPNLIISFQNTGVLFPNVKQLIYYHQSIPLFNHKWKFYRKDESVLFFYKEIYPLFIRLMLNRNTEFVVQQEFLKKLFSAKFHINEAKIHVIVPDINLSFESKIQKIVLDQRKFHIFYPTNLAKYKNYYILFEAISLIAITNTIFSYKNLPKRYRYSVFILILFSIASSVGSATRSGIVQILIISLAAFSLGVYKKNIILKYYHKVLIFFFGASIIIGFLIYSSLLTNTRGGRIVNNPLTNEPPREDFFLTRITSPKLHPLINNVSFYISHSYYRLNKAMNLPFKGLGFGLSNSYFIMDNVESLTGWSGLKNISYGVRLDKGIGRGYGLYWSTFYTWIASDFTFPGTIIVIFFIGYFFSLSLRDSLSYLNPLSVTVFCALFYFIFHFAFNNPLQDGPGLTNYFFVPMIWLLFRKRYK